MKELDALVSTGGGSMSTEVPSVERVIGSQEKLVGPFRDEWVPTSGPLGGLPIYSDHYGFNNLIGIDY